MRALKLTLLLIDVNNTEGTNGSKVSLHLIAHTCAEVTALIGTNNVASAAFKLHRQALIAFSGKFNNYEAFVFVFSMELAQNLF